MPIAKTLLPSVQKIKPKGMYHFINEVRTAAVLALQKNGKLDGKVRWRCEPLDVVQDAATLNRQLAEYDFTRLVCQRDGKWHPHSFGIAVWIDDAGVLLGQPTHQHPNQVMRYSFPPDRQDGILQVVDDGRLQILDAGLRTLWNISEVCYPTAMLRLYWEGHFLLPYDDEMLKNMTTSNFIDPLVHSDPDATLYSQLWSLPMPGTSMDVSAGSSVPLPSDDEFRCSRIASSIFRGESAMKDHQLSDDERQLVWEILRLKRQTDSSSDPK